MKRSIVIAAFAALVLTACEQKIDIIEVPQSSDPVVFTARTESTSTKTALSENGGAYDVVWREGDQITLVDGAATPNVGLYTTTSTTTEATFTFVPESGSEASTAPYKAWYPASIYNDGTPTLPATQQYVEGNIGCAPMFASSNTTELQFKNLGGIICLNLSTSMSEISVSSISMSATQPMSGPISNVASLSSETPVAATLTGSAGVTLDCGAGVAINGTAKPFYIAVPANTYTGLSVTVTTTAGAFQTFTLKSERTVVVGRNQIVAINLSANNIHSEYNLTAGNVTVLAGETATVTGSNGNSVLTIGAGATVTLQDATLKQIVTQGDATLTLSGTNTMNTVFNGSAAIILGESSTFTFDGDGILNCDRGSSQNGGCVYGNNSNLIVKGGDIRLRSCTYPNAKDAIIVKNYTQQGGSLSASGRYTSNKGTSVTYGLWVSNDIIISGGNLTADGGYGVWSGNNITISGGTVNAQGAGNDSGSTGLAATNTLTITGGTVSAISGGSGGENTGPGMSGDVIIISGGNITASGNNNKYQSGGSAGIGTGSAESGTFTSITITSGIERLVVTKAPAAYAPIGKGNASSSVGTITIDGVENPTAESFFTGLSLAVSNGGNTWTLTPASNTPASLANLKDMVNADKDCSAYIGRYVYSDGSIGTGETDAIGIVAYMSKTATQLTGINESCRVLVLGLTDLSTSVDFGTAWDFCNAQGPAIAGVEWSNWRIPTTGQWNVICQSDGLGQGSFANLSGDASQAELRRDLTYWTSTIHHNDAYDYGWPWTIHYSDPWNDENLAYVYWSWARSDTTLAARACFGY